MSYAKLGRISPREREVMPSLRGANGSRECAPDDRLRDEAIHITAVGVWIASLALAMTLFETGARNILNCCPGRASDDPGPNRGIHDEVQCRTSFASTQAWGRRPGFHREVEERHPQKENARGERAFSVVDLGVLGRLHIHVATLGGW